MKFFKTILFVFSLFFVSAYSFHVKKFEKHFVDVLYAEDLGIIKDTRVLNITGATNPCNASIIKYNDEFLLSFRENRAHGNVGLGLVRLNQNFEQQSPPIFLDFQLIDKKINGARDARLFTCNDNIYLTYAFVEKIKLERKNFTFTFGISKLGDLLTPSLKLIPRKESTNFLRFSPIYVWEKNWTAFSYAENSSDGFNDEIINFIYTFDPYTIASLDSSYNLKKIVETDKFSKFLKENWETRWGEVRGGTSALLVDNEYLTFFHSCIRQERDRIYVFGAITFEKEFPFNIKRISRFPIISRQFFTLKPSKNVWFANSKQDIRSFFPCGFVVSENQDGSIFHVFGGDNDSAVRLVTIDKKTLFKYMVDINVS